jgi:CheY-like chemotaxis protein
MEKLQRILHVDDDEDIRTIAKMTLELIGNFHVDQFSSGKDAIENALACRPQLFLLDVMMPEMSGEETWRRLLEIPTLERVPTIFMTAKAEKQFTKSLMEQGALAVITKPFDPQELCEKIVTAWEGSFF